MFIENKLNTPKNTCKKKKPVRNNEQFSKFPRSKINTQKSVVVYTLTVNNPKRKLRK